VTLNSPILLPITHRHIQGARLDPEKAAIRSCMPLAFNASGRASQCFGRVNMRSLLCPPLVIVGKGLKLTRNRSVGHGLGGAEQSLRCL